MWQIYTGGMWYTCICRGWTMIDFRKSSVSSCLGKKPPCWTAVQRNAAKYLQKITLNWTMIVIAYLEIIKRFQAIVHLYNDHHSLPTDSTRILGYSYLWRGRWNETCNSYILETAGSSKNKPILSNHVFNASIVLCITSTCIITYKPFIKKQFGSNNNIIKSQAS